MVPGVPCCCCVPRHCQAKELTWGLGMEDTSVQPEVSREAQAMALRMSADLTGGSILRRAASGRSGLRSSTGSALLLRSHSSRSHGGADTARASAGGGEFEFMPVQAPPQPPEDTGQSRPSAPHATPAWPQHDGSSTTTAGPVQGTAGGGQGGGPSSAHSASSLHITPAMDVSLSKYASVTPLSTANLSPGTSSLLNRVFGTSTHTQSGKSCIGVSAISGRAEEAVPAQLQPAPHHHHQQQHGPYEPQQSMQRRSSLRAQPPPDPSAPSHSPKLVASHPLEHDCVLVRGASSCSNSGSLTAGAGEGLAGAAPLLCPVTPEAYAKLPMFLRSQLSLDHMNAILLKVCGLLGQQVGAKAVGSSAHAIPTCVRAYGPCWPPGQADTHARLSCCLNQLHSLLQRAPLQTRESLLCVRLPCRPKFFPRTVLPLGTTRAQGSRFLTS